MKKIFFGAFSSQLVKGLLPLIIIPLFLSEWGNDIYTTWLQSIALVAFVSFFGTGLNTYGINRSQIAFAQNLVSANKVYDTLLSLNIFMFLIASIAQFFILLAINILIGLPDLWLTIILGFYMAINNLFSYINLIYRIKDKYHLSLYFSIVFTLILYSVMAFILINDLSPIFLASWMLFFTFSSSLLQLILIRIILGLGVRLTFSIRRFIPYILRSYKFLFFQVGDYFRINLPIVFLGYVASPALVVLYTINRTLSNILSQFYILIHHTIIQKITATYARNPGSTEKLIYLVTGYTTFSFLIYISFILLETYKSILELWIGESYLSYYDFDIFLLLLANSLLYCIWNIGTVFLVATNNFSKLSNLSALHGVACFTSLAAGFLISGLEMMLFFGIVSEIIFGMFVINKEVYKYLKLGIPEYSPLFLFTFFQTLIYSTIHLSFDSLFISIFMYSVLLLLICLVFWRFRFTLRTFLEKGA